MLGSSEHTECFGAEFTQKLSERAWQTGHERSLWSSPLHVSPPWHYEENTAKLEESGLLRASPAGLHAGPCIPKPSTAQPGVNFLKCCSHVPERVHHSPWPTGKGANVSLTHGALHCCMPPKLCLSSAHVALVLGSHQTCQAGPCSCHCTCCALCPECLSPLPLST